MSSDRPQKTILIAEDSAEIAALLERALQSDYTLLMMPDGAAALAAGSRHPVDLLLTDIMMPVMDGFDLARQLRMIPGREHVPIVFITAKDTAQDHIKGIRLGATHYIVKPFSLLKVLEKVRKILG